MAEVIDLNISALGNGIIDPKVTVVGIGGAGTNIVNGLRDHVEGVETVAVNTDAQHLFDVNADKKILIGKNITRGMGALHPEVGAKAAENSAGIIEETLDGDIVVLVSGLGGGTGTGAAPIIAEIAKNRAITLAIAIKPFTMEGQARNRTAKSGLEALQETLTSVIIIENDSLLKFSDLNLSDAMLDIPKKLVARIVKGVVEQITMSFLTTLEEELVDLLADDMESEFCTVNDMRRGEPEKALQVEFEGSKFVENNPFDN
jgi:cell division protein FtsZ